MSEETWARWFKKINEQGLVWNEPTKSFIKKVVSEQEKALQLMIDKIPVSEEEE